MSGSHDYYLKLWDAATGECVQTLEGHTSYVLCIAALPNCDIVSGSADRTLKVWEDTEGKMARLIALRRTQTDFAGRAIAEFL